MVKRFVMRKSVVVVAVAAVAVAVGVVMYATAAPSWDVPQTLHYQGRLLDSSGAPVTGTVPITFRIWADETSIAPAYLLWADMVSVNLDASGFFEVSLGATAGRELPSGLLEGEPRWLGIEPRTSGELSPRQLVQSVPYALRAGMASGLARNADIEAATLTVSGVDPMARIADLESRLAMLEAGVPWTSITGRPGWLVTSGTVVRTQIFRWFGLPDDVQQTVTSSAWTTIGRLVEYLSDGYLGFDGAPAGTARRYRLRVHYSTYGAGGCQVEFRVVCTGWASPPLSLSYSSDAGTRFIFASWSPAFGLTAGSWASVQARLPGGTCPPSGGAYVYGVDLLAEDVVP
ncbi:MAG: hypothetical protein QME96_04490 [Myxococcota bacterium]|nr:hypothetical protein [Myxococcota bacterium]